MMNTSENFLKQHFLSKANCCSKGVLAGQEYLVSTTMIYIGSTKLKDTPFAGAYGLHEIPNVTFEAVVPENRCFKESLIDATLYNKHRQATFMQVDNVLADITSDFEIQVAFKTLLRKYTFPIVAPEEVPLDCRVYIGCGTNGSPVLRLVKNTSMLLIPFGAVMYPEKFSFNYHGLTITPQRWSDPKQAYTTLKKEGNMPKLTIPPITSLLKDSDSVEPVVDDLQTEADAVAMLDELTKEDTPESVTETNETAEQPPVAEETEEAPSESTSKPKRKMKPKGTLMDLTAVIDSCGAAIPDDVTPEDAVKEIRQLRDLIKVAVCRETNLALSILEKTGKAAATLEALKATLGALK